MCIEQLDWRSSVERGRTDIGVLHALDLFHGAEKCEKSAIGHGHLLLLVHLYHALVGYWPVQSVDYLTSFSIRSPP